MSSLDIYIMEGVACPFYPDPNYAIYPLDEADSLLRRGLSVDMVVIF